MVVAGASTASIRDRSARVTSALVSRPSAMAVVSWSIDAYAMSAVAECGSIEVMRTPSRIGPRATGIRSGDARPLGDMLGP